MSVSARGGVVAETREEAVRSSRGCGSGAAYPDGNIMEGLVAGSWLLICSGVLYGGATLADCLAWLEARS